MNRETAAAVTAVNTGLLIFLAAVLFAMVNHPGPGEEAAGRGGPLEPPWASTPIPEGEPEPVVDPLLERGWSIYLAERCSSCHSIAGRGSPRYPLDGVGDRLDPEQLRLWVVDPQRARPGVRKRPYDHLSDEDVGALVALLETLRGR
jgi:mono/diheme cytochrome c family protein